MRVNYLYDSKLISSHQLFFFFFFLTYPTLLQRKMQKNKNTRYYRSKARVISGKISQTK